MAGTETTPVFKGCTRPACLFGVPVAPLVAVTGGIFLLAFWTWLPLAFLVFPAVLTMRAVTKYDDQAFLQRAIRLRVRRMNANRSYWRGAASYSPAAYKRRDL